MDEYTNSATRLLAVIEKLQANPVGTPIALVWAQVLGLDTDKTKEDPHDLREKLSLIRLELNLVQKQMEAKPFSQGLYKPYLGNIRNVVSVSNLDSQWGNFKHLLNNETILALRYCCEILPRDTIIPFTELEGLLERVMELKKEIEDSSYANDTKEYLLHLLSIMEKGIRDYPLSGGTSFTEAFHEVARVASNDGPHRVPAEDDGYAKVMQLVRGCWSMSKEVVHMDRLLALVGTKLEQGKLFLEWSITPLG